MRYLVTSEVSEVRGDRSGSCEPATATSCSVAPWRPSAPRGSDRAASAAAAWVAGSGGGDFGAVLLSATSDISQSQNPTCDLDRETDQSDRERLQLYFQHPAVGLRLLTEPQRELPMYLRKVGGRIPSTYEPMITPASWANRPSVGRQMSTVVTTTMRNPRTETTAPTAPGRPTAAARSELNARPVPSATVATRRGMPVRSQRDLPALPSTNGTPPL